MCGTDVKISTSGHQRIVPPRVMGIGPFPATKKLLEKTGVSLSRIDIIELNEAFAAQAIACIRDLELDPATAQKMAYYDFLSWVQESITTAMLEG